MGLELPKRSKEMVLKSVNCRRITKRVRVRGERYLVGAGSLEEVYWTLSCIYLGFDFLDIHIGEFF